MSELIVRFLIMLVLLVVSIAATVKLVLFIHKEIERPTKNWWKAIIFLLIVVICDLIIKILGKY